MAAIEKDLLTLLDEIGIAYELFRHPPFFTVADGEDFKAKHPGGHGKCLFLKDGRGKFVLAAVSQERRVDLKLLANLLRMGRLSFCKADEVEALLGVKPGAVTPYAAINLRRANPETPSKLEVVVDETLTGQQKVFFHPLHNEATIAVAPSGLLAFLSHCGIHPRILDPA